MPHPGDLHDRSAHPLKAQSVSRLRKLCSIFTSMQPDLSPEDCAAIAALVREVIAADRFPLSPRIKSLRTILINSIRQRRGYRRFRR